MNIDSVSQTARPGEVAGTTLAAKATAPAESQASTAPAEQTRVELSRTAKLIAKNDAAANAAATASDTSTAASSTGSITEKLPVKQTQSFVYGALGLERPDEAPKKEDAFYTAGKWLSAAGTAGMVISLLV